jgi:hypothetical protein
MRGHCALYERDKVAGGFRRRAGARLQAATPDRPKPAAARAELCDGHTHACWFWHARCAGGKAEEIDAAEWHE